MRQILKDNLPFLILYIIFLVPSVLLLIIFSKEQIHLAINSFHTDLFDFFFLYITFLGSGVFAIIVALILLFIKFRYFLIAILSFISSAFVAQFLKRVVFYDVDRPAEFFKNIVDLHIVKGQKILYHFSFPSGHSVTIFALCFALSYFVKNSLLKLLFALIAIIVAFSRVYLSQHFLIDIVVGSLIGIIFSMISILLLKDLKTNIKILKNKYNENSQISK